MPAKSNTVKNPRLIYPCVQAAPLIYGIQKSEKNISDFFQLKKVCREALKFRPTSFAKHFALRRISGSKLQYHVAVKLGQTTASSSGNFAMPCPSALFLLVVFLKFPLEIMNKCQRLFVFRLSMTTPNVPFMNEGLNFR